MRKVETQRTVRRERAFLVGRLPRGRNGHAADALEEIQSLAETSGVQVVGGAVQKRDRPDPATWIGSGKADEVATRARDAGAHVVVFDVDLSPAQVRNLEKRMNLRVVDRTTMILDIFARHARTSQAKLQVELAQLEYALPRLRRMWTHLGQQTGGMSATGGPGIGIRGPGEKQLEMDRRLARDRIVALKRELQEIEARKEREVGARVANHFAVSLVGYTNAGKSTLMNALTGAGVLVEDRLFSTLDTRTRVWRLPEGLPVLLSDTVGFIRNLPHALVASFHATLEEVSQADLLLHVADASHPEAAEQIEAVDAVLREIGCADKPTILVLNKADRLRDGVEMDVLRARRPGSVGISALGGVGLAGLAARVSEALSAQLSELSLAIPATEGRLLADVHARCVILDESSDGDRVILRLRAPRHFAFRLASYRR